MPAQTLGPLAQHHSCAALRVLTYGWWVGEYLHDSVSRSRARVVCCGWHPIRCGWVGGRTACSMVQHGAWCRRRRVRKDQHTSKRMRAWNRKTQEGTYSNCTRTQSCAVGQGPRGGPSRSGCKNQKTAVCATGHSRPLHDVSCVCPHLRVFRNWCSTHPSAYRPSIIPAGSCVKLHDGTAVVDAADAARDAASEMSHMGTQRESAGAFPARLKILPGPGAENGASMQNRTEY
jgi:hypothetical protein